MLIAYVDESYDSDFYFVGAAVADEYQWELFGNALDQIRALTVAQHQIPVDVEFHAYELMSGAGGWTALRGKHREAAGIYRAVLSAANAANVRFLFRGLDLNQIRVRRGSLQDPHGEVLMHLLEDLDAYTVRKKQQDRTVVVADEIGTQAEHAKQFRGYQELGTWGYRSKILDMLEPPIRFVSSVSEYGLQLADFGVYLHRRRETVVERNRLARKSVERLCRALDPLTHSHKIWPAKNQGPA